MSSAIVALVCVALVLVAGLLMGQASLSSVSLTSDSWKQMGERTSEIAGTNIQIISISQSTPYTEAIVRNTGRLPLADFAYWEVIAQYYTSQQNYNVTTLTYTTSANPGNNEWKVKGIYRNAVTPTPTTEVYEPNILNPGEDMIIKMKLVPAGGSATNWLIIATPNGIATSATFQ